VTGDRKPLLTFWTPRYWPAWLGMGVLRFICVLPHPVSMGIGRLIGRVAHAAGGTRRAIVRRNIELCFPELTPAERDTMAKAHFLALGMSLIEMGLGRWGSDKIHRKLGRLEGIEHLNSAIESGKGIILLSAHFTTLEIMGRVLALNCPPFDAVYRKNRSEFITEIQRTGRERSADDTIEKPFFHVDSPTAVMFFEFFHRWRIFLAMTTSRTLVSMSAFSRSTCAAARNSTYGFIESSRTCPAAIRTITPILKR
jgi:lauroyl/myristoyl acyltransferase